MGQRGRQHAAHSSAREPIALTRLQLLAAASRRLEACRGMAELSQVACECLLETIEVRRAVLLRIEQDEARPLWLAPPITDTELAAVVEDSSLISARPELRRLILDRTPSRSHRAEGSQDGQPSGDPAELALLARLGVTAEVCAPVVVNGGVWGALIATRLTGHFDDDDMAATEMLAALVAAAVIRLDFEHQVFHLLAEDPLTGLADRRVADAAAERALATGVETCIVMCDVDGLKQVNDELGHAAGDDLLRMVAGVLRHSADALPGTTAARIGGDEFCLVVPGWPRTTVEDVLITTMDEHPLPHGAAISWGVAASSIGERVPISSLFRAADFAQYRAKRARARRRQLALPDATDPMVTAQQVLSRALPAIASARPGALSRLCALASTATDTLGGGAWTVLREREPGDRIVVARGGSPAAQPAAVRTVAVDHGAWTIEVGASLDATLEGRVRTALSAAMYVAAQDAA
ncbi:MAG: diguanylate cyclase [Actinobacteria bacterium]|nr:diguanylate cyclase [Actinomycetota bacterium]MCG2803102.1 diguanylate cyclase [Cellulomonas sp.]